TFILQNTRDQFADVGFVINDEDIHGHRLTVARGFAYLGFAFLTAGNRLRRENEAHPSAPLPRDFFGGIVKLDAPSVLLKDSPNNGEPQASTFFPGSDIRLQQSAAVLFRQPNAIIDNIDDDVTAVADC